MSKTSNSTGQSSGLKLPGALFQPFFNALTAGFIGFISFFSALVISNLINQNSVVNFGDILLSSVGFLCLFMLSLLEREKK